MASAIELLLLAQSAQSPQSVTYTSASTTLINSGTDALVNGLSMAVVAGTTYVISALVAYVATSTGGAPVFTFHGPTASGAVVATEFLDSAAGTVSAARVLNGGLGSAATGPTMTATDTCAYRASGLVVFSTSGTLTLQAHTSVTADTFTCQPMSYVTLTALP